jgi:cell division protein FtsW
MGSDETPRRKPIKRQSGEKGLRRPEGVVLRGAGAALRRPDQLPRHSEHATQRSLLEKAARDRAGGGGNTTRFGPAIRRTGGLPGFEGPQRDRHEPDYVILVSVLALAAIGILMVYSASAIPSYAQSNNTFQMVAPQIAAGLAGLAAMVALMRLDYRYLRNLSVPLAAVAIVLLIVVLVPGMGVTVGGSARWLRMPLFQVHPAEVAKLALIVYLAHWLAARGTKVRSFWYGTIPFGIIVVPFVVLVAREPDIGTTAVIALIGLTLFFVAGANLLHLGLALLAGLAGAAGLILAIGTVPLQRLQTFLDPWSDPNGAGLQTIRGLTALGAGGLFGTGLGNERVNVPNDFNDFIFSHIAQELGMVGGLVVIGLFVALAWGGIRTALRAPDTFGGLMAAGITAWVVFQALINIGVVLAVVPVTGITLPFVSAGGSSLVVSFAAIGVLLSISRETVEGGAWNAPADRGRGYGRTYLPGSRGGSIAASHSDLT